jgi:HSP20 family protein
MIFDFDDLEHMGGAEMDVDQGFRQGHPVRGGGKRSKRVITPPYDLFEKDDNVIVFVDLPGVPKDHVNVTVANDILTITGRRPGIPPTEFTQDETVLRERNVGKFFRRISLNEHVDQENVEAKLEGGVLQVILKKSPHLESKKIEVQ